MSFYTRPDNFPPIVKNLMIINGLFFLATSFLMPGQLYLEGVEETGLKGVLGLWPIGTDYFRPYQLFTHMFTHDDFRHILFNMLNLWLFGKMLESVWGPKKFLSFYLICGIGAAIAHLAEQYFTGGFSFAIGASGAVMGVMVAAAYLFPNTEIMMGFLMIPIKIKWLVSVMVAVDLFTGLGEAKDGIAHWAHLGGAAVGLALVLYWNKTNKKTFY
jgi:membrane associated rhomboid family serine protease